MLNAGLQPTDIAHVHGKGYELAKRTVRWQRQKNDRLEKPNDHEVESLLWPETAAVVEKFMCPGDGLAFRNAGGGPLYHETKSGNRHNAVTKSLNKFFERIERVHGLKVTAKNFRQTGAQLIHEVTGDYGLSQVWLGRPFKVVDKPYLVRVYDHLFEASEKVRERLVAGGCFAGTKQKVKKGQQKQREAA
jgi:hypothetical protein